MADYNPNQFDLTPAEKEWNNAFGKYSTPGPTAKSEVERLKAEVEELRKEVKALKGIKTYEITVSKKVTYIHEAENEDAARTWYHHTGQYLTPNGPPSVELMNIKESDE